MCKSSSLTRPERAAPQARCRRTWSYVVPATGEVIRRPCGRWRCSEECRDYHAWKYSLIYARSFGLLPPKAFIRITVHEAIPGAEYERGVRTFLRKLTYRQFEYLLKHEWSRRRHFHLLLHSGREEPTPGLVRELWAESLAGSKFTHYCRPVSDAAALARYVTKHCCGCRKKEPPPEEFRGHLYRKSKRFLAKSARELWEDELRERHGERRPPPPSGDKRPELTDD